ncbi:MAG: hypothetical protein R2911_34405 [Caldilineaceae bacterium]
MTYLAIARHLENRDYDSASTMLIDAVASAGELFDAASICPLISQFPNELFDANPDLLRIRARCLLHDELLEQAAVALQRASALYMVQQNYNRAADCTFELVRIYHRRDDFRTALLHLQDAEALLPKISDEALRPHLHLRLAMLYPDIGRLDEGIEQARQAYDLFKFAGNLTQQFKTTILIAILHRQLGQYGDAAAHLTMARTLYGAGALDHEAYVALLNGEAHLEWYRGDLTAALAKAVEMHQYTQQHPTGKYQLYSAVLLGNIQRGLQHYDEAYVCYQEARGLVERFGLPLFGPWIEVQAGWLNLLMERHVEARQLIYTALETHDRGQMMSFNVYLAALNALMGYLRQAETLLHSSLEFYARSGDELAEHEIQFHLAYVEIRLNRASAARARVTTVFQWLRERHSFYLPLWWHPQIAAHVCTFAIAERIEPLLAERMIVRHIQEAALPALRPLLEHAAAAVREQSRHLVEMLDGNPLIHLGDVKDERIRDVLETLLAQGVLQPSGFARLQAKLTTAQTRRTSNSVLVAVFGLYINGVGRAEIAKRLGRSPAGIRNYITTIYAIFNIPPQGFRNHIERFEHLQALAREEGFI